MKKSKAQSKQLSEELAIAKKQKKPKNKKNKKNLQSKNNIQNKLFIQQQAKNEVDQIGLQLSQLRFDGNLAPNYEICNDLNQRLEQLTINLIQKMIMKQSFIHGTIRFAKINKLTPKQYFVMNYTNKLCYISKLLDTCPRKYGRFKQQIQVEITRVENIILRSLQDVKIVDEVFNDLCKNNVEWEVNHQFFD